MSTYYRRPPILDKIPRDRHAVIEASAGTGKTYTIEHMVIDLLLCKQAKVSLSDILVLTFTERAASELRRRIRSKIDELLLKANTGAETHARGPEEAWLIDDDARQRLLRALFAFDAASIGTIHGFFGRVLMEHAFANGRLFEGTLKDGRELFGRAFKTALRHSLACQPGDAAALLSVWLEKTQDGVEGLENLLWKSHISRRRVLPPCSLEAIWCEIEASPLFDIDLLEEAEAFQTALKTAGVKHAGTLKAIMTRVTDLSGLIRASGRSWATVLDDRFQEAIAYISDRVGDRTLGNDQARLIAGSIKRLRDVLVSLEAAITQTSLPIVRAALEHNKTTTGEFDYDDLIAAVARALDGSGGKELIRSMRGRYRFALIDEFQDTDELQWSFFQRVFVESNGRNIAYLIGDPKQAIYGFRGADVFTYIDAREKVEQAGTPRVPLFQNFRSSRALIEGYNHILDASASSPFFDGDIRYDRPVEAGCELVALEADGSGAMPIHLLTVEPRKESTLSINELQRGLARQIAREIRDLLAGKKGLSFGPEGETKRVEPGNIYVLTATNKDARLVSRALREGDVPFAFYKQEGLFQTDEAREIRDLLAAIDEPSDRGRRGRAWITPFFAVPLAVLPDLAELPDSHPLLKRLIDWNTLAVNHRFETLFSRILDDSGVIRRELFLKDDERALTNYLHIFEVLLEDARTAGCELSDLIATLTAFIQEVRKPAGENGNVQRLESDRAAVQIMTIHKSKGLEAAVVFLFGGFTAFRGTGIYEYHEGKERVLYIGENDQAKEAAKAERKHEDERLYYVAMTRAKARLYLPFVPGHLWGKSWSGGYRRVNERLAEVIGGLESSGKSHLFKSIIFKDDPISHRRDDMDRHSQGPVSWSPSDALFKDRHHYWEFAEYRRRHAGYEVSSYSRMKRAWSGELDPLERDEFRREPGRAAIVVTPAEGDLPGGTAAGLMLHEIIEKIPFDSPSRVDSPTLDTWRLHTSVAGVITEAMVRNNVAPIYRSQVEGMVYHALTVKIPVDEGKSIPGLCHCPKILREMEFLFPFPEESHPRLFDPAPGKFIIERGFIKGFVDLVVEHDNRVYFADWKSDVLPSYDLDTLSKQVADHYDLQAKLYALALVRALTISSEADYEKLFGGLFYVFLRAARRENAAAPGVYFKRPNWVEILSYENELKQGPLRNQGGR
jgi:exodeoxyribonuclease V beta subunit